MDGIRVDNRMSGLGAGGQEASRLDDFNPEDIESIEIVKGPSAGTLYGTEAANGVIRITTRRGLPGPTRWNLWTEGGLIREPNTYPLNFAGLDIRSVRLCPELPPERGGGRPLQPDLDRVLPGAPRPRTVAVRRRQPHAARPLGHGRNRAHQLLHRGRKWRPRWGRTPSRRPDREDLEAARHSDHQRGGSAPISCCAGI